MPMAKVKKNFVFTVIVGGKKNKRERIAKEIALSPK